MKGLFSKRFVSLVLILMLTGSALPVHGYAFEMEPMGEIGRDQGEAPVVTEELKAWVLREQGLNGEEEFLTDAYYLQFYEAYMSVQNGVPTEAEDYDLYKTGGVSESPIDIGSGPQDDVAFFIDEEDFEEVEFEDIEDEDEGKDEIEVEVEIEAEDHSGFDPFTQEQAEIEADDAWQDALFIEEIEEEAYDFYQHMDDEEEVLLLDDDPVYVEVDEIEVEEVEVEEEQNLTLTMIPAVGSFMFTGNMISPEFQIVNDEDGSVVAARTDGNTDEWTWGGDVTAVEVGEYTATVQSRDTLLTVPWEVTPALLSFTPASLIILEGDELEAQLQELVETVRKGIIIQNFGTPLGDLSLRGGVDNKWFPTKDGVRLNPHFSALTISQWCPQSTYLTTAYEGSGLKLIGNKMNFYIGGTTNNNTFDLGKLIYGEQDLNIRKFAVQVEYTPQPVKLGYKDDAVMMYGEKLPFFIVSEGPLAMVVRVDVFVRDREILVFWIDSESIFLANAFKLFAPSSMRVSPPSLISIAPHFPFFRCTIASTSSPSLS